MGKSYRKQWSSLRLDSAVAAVRRRQQEEQADAIGIRHSRELEWPVECRDNTDCWKAKRKHWRMLTAAPSRCQSTQTQTPFTRNRFPLPLSIVLSFVIALTLFFGRSSLLLESVCLAGKRLVLQVSYHTRCAAAFRRRRRRRERNVDEKKG